MKVMSYVLILETANIWQGFNIKTKILCNLKGHANAWPFKIKYNLVQIKYIKLNIYNTLYIVFFNIIIIFKNSS